MWSFVSAPVSRRGYFFHRPIIDELLSPVIGEALRFRSPLAACSASMSSCLRSASRLALAADSFAAAALSAHLLASCRRCSERVLILQVADYFAATALPGAFGEVGPLTVRALRQLQDAESVAAICCHGRAAMHSSRHLKTAATSRAAVERRDGCHSLSRRVRASGWDRRT